MANFYDKLAALCADVGLTISNFVESELGLRRSTATSWRRGAKPNRATLLKIMERFGVSDTYLMNDSVPVINAVEDNGATAVSLPAPDSTDDRIAELERTVASQQRTIEALSKSIENLSATQAAAKKPVRLSSNGVPDTANKSLVGV